MESINVELTEKELLKLDTDLLDVQIFETVYNRDGSYFNNLNNAREIYSNTVKKENLKTTVDMFLNEYLEYDNMCSKKGIASIELTIFINNIFGGVTEIETDTVFIGYEIDRLKEIVGDVDSIKKMDIFDANDEICRTIDIIENILTLKGIKYHDYFNEYIDDTSIADFSIFDYENEMENYIDIFFKKVNSIIDYVKKNWF